MRSNLATLRSDVELSLAGRVVSPFGYRDRKSVEMVLTGIPEIDALAGGFPRGALTELCGPLATTAIQTVRPLRREQHGGDGAARPAQIDTCHALAASGEVVAKYWPRFHQRTG